MPIDLSKDARMIDMRRSIDHFDVSFLRLLAERTRLVKKIMFIKSTTNLDLNQSEARVEDKKELIEMSVQLELEKTFFKQILDFVFQDAMAHFRYEDNSEEGEEMAHVCQGLALDDLRRSLLNLDKSLCIVLAERFCVVKRIGKYKEELSVPPLDMVRWEQVLSDKMAMAETLGISVTLIKDIFNAIHQVALTIEDDIKSK